MIHDDIRRLITPFYIHDTHSTIYGGWLHHFLYMIHDDIQRLITQFYIHDTRRYTAADNTILYTWYTTIYGGWLHHFIYMIHIRRYTAADYTIFYTWYTTIYGGWLHHFIYMIHNDIRLLITPFCIFKLFLIYVFALQIYKEDIEATIDSFL
jgi:hypothetical protein